MTAKLERPRFTRAYITSIGKSFDQRGFRALIPLWLIAFSGLGGAVAFYLPETFWDVSNQTVSVVVYTGLLTINGLILALSWSAFSRIHECISAGRFGLYLFEKDQLGDYIVYIGYVHATQLVAITVSAIGLFVLLFNAPLDRERAALAAMICFSAYAIRYAAASVTIMHNLIWQNAIFEQSLADAEEQEQGDGEAVPSSDRVVIIRKRD